MLKKNDIVTLTITDLTNEGMGVAKLDGYVLFVPKTAIGDVISARVLKTLTSHGFAKVEEILTPSPDLFFQNVAAVCSVISPMKQSFKSKKAG